MNKNVSANDQLSRMKALMNYGLQTENKKTPFSELEFQKVAADGNTYAIIREGKAYYIEMAKPKKGELLKEDFNYIGGFRNRGDHKYNSYADAQKNFDLMMMSIKEAKNANDFVVESWDLDKKENVVLEASEKMRKEILRERQIMNNAKSIVEKKAVCCDDVECPKDNIKSEKPQTGDAKDAVDHEEAELPKDMTEGKACPKCGKNPCQCESVNEEEVLGWNRGNDEYMDKSHGTEIGDSAPFDAAEARNIDDGDKKVTNTGYMKNGVVEEGDSMHDKDNQNDPTPGVGEGPSDEHNKPFNAEKGKQIDEAIDDIDDDVEDDVELGDEGVDDVEFDGEDNVEDADFGDDENLDADAELDDADVDADAELDDAEVDADIYEGDTEARLSALEELISKIAVKLGVDDVDVDADDYEDEPLFDDEEGDGEYDLELGDEEPEDDFDAEEDDNMPMEGRRYMRNGVEIVETRSYVNAMRKLNEEGMKPFTDAGRVPQGNMNKLNDFGKHPAYQKRVMSLPPKDLQEFPDYYDMNDDSVKNDAPYGEKIGSGDPFEIKPDVIANAISESIRKVLKKK